MVYVVLALAMLGFNFTSLAMVAGGLSVGFGLGFQAICGNLLSGVWLVFSQTIKVGDFVEVDGDVGTVKSINFRATELETFEKAIVSIPNYSIMSGRFINWTRDHLHARRKVTIQTAYNVDIDKVLDILKEAAAKATDQVLTLDKPVAVLEGFGENFMIFSVYVTIKNIKTQIPALSEIRLFIENRFKKEGIAIYRPTLDLTVSESPKLLNLNKVEG
jgi:small-conductance mechanosensitive channel